MESQVGVIGVGNMGLGLALRMLDTGHKVGVHDVLTEREMLAMDAGAWRAGSPAELAQRCAVIAVVVVDATQTRQVLFADRGVANGRSQVQTVLLCPTIGARDVEEIAAELATHGIACIDAPMSGGPARARDGSMSLMVACADAQFTQHETLLRDISARLFRVGQRPGDGARTKLVNNLLAAVNLAGAAEAIALAQQLGLDPAKTLQVIEQSSGQSWIGSDRMARALAGDFEPRAHTSLLAKDSGLAIAMAREAGVEPRLGALAAAMFRAACEAGHAGEDDGSLLRYVGGAGSSAR